MIKSMTGYGKSEAILNGRQFLVEIKSFNHRYLDISHRLPGLLIPLELEIKKKISERFSRGRVELTIRIESDGKQNDSRFELNLPLIRNYYALLMQLKTELNLKDEITLEMISGIKDAFIHSETDEDSALIWEEVEKILDRAIDNLLEMREKEGAVLCQDMMYRIDMIRSSMDVIMSRKSHMVFEYQKRLSERVRELTGGMEIDELRLSQEIAFMAEKSDITEEIVRFNSHIGQFLDLLREDDVIGRKVDFLIQEMNREINTIASKSADALISKNVIEIKSELAKLREQVQNLE